MSRNERGAAQVSMMWVIVFAVIAIVSAGYGFLMDSELAAREQTLATFEQEAENLRAENADLRETQRSWSQAVGFLSGENQEFSSVDAVEASRNEIVTAFGLDDSNVRHFSDVVGPAITVYRGVVDERDSLQAEVEQLRNDLAARNDANREAMNQKDETIATLRSEKEDLQNSLNSQIVDLERTRDSLREEFRDLERQNAELRARFDQERRELQTELAVLEQRNSILASRLNQVRRRADTPDGAMLSVSPELGLDWIDRGRSDRVLPGMEFDVRNADTGAHKGRVRVTSVEDQRAEVSILSQADKYDPIRSGDVILNEIYDPERTPVAVLLGSSFGRYNAEDVRSMLGEVGVEVRSEVSKETDFLLLGTPFFDEETGEMVPWESRDAYKAAEAFSVQVIPLRDWTQWLGK